MDKRSTTQKDVLPKAVRTKLRAQNYRCKCGRRIVAGTFFKKGSKLVCSHCV